MTHPDTSHHLFGERSWAHCVSCRSLNPCLSLLVCAPFFFLVSRNDHVYPLLPSLLRDLDLYTSTFTPKDVDWRPHYVNLGVIHTRRLTLMVRHSFVVKSYSKDLDAEEKIISRAGVVRGQAGHSIRSAVRDKKGLCRISRVEYGSSFMTLAWCECPEICTVASRRRQNHTFVQVSPALTYAGLPEAST